MITQNKIIPTDAAAIDRIGKRLKVQETPEHLELIKDDMYNSIQGVLDKDGHTGKLSNPDGIIRGKPQVYKGFFVQCFGMKKYAGEFDVFGKMGWFGYASRKIIAKGTEVKIRFATEAEQPLGFENERDCGGWLFKMVDLFNEKRN
jgi:hypothetical protein